MVDWRRIRRAAVTVVVSTGRPSDARRSGGAGSGARTSGRSVRAKRRPAVFVLLGVVFLMGSAAALFASGGFIEHKRLEARRDAANIELDRQLERVHALRREVEGLSSESLARERLAREELGYTRRGEMIFLLAEPPESPKKTTP